MSQIQIHLSQRCHENWQAMTSAQNGRFCPTCRHKVYDFTKSSDEAIVQKTLEEKNVCGRFRVSQLNHNGKVFPKSKMWRYLIAGFLAATSIASDKIYAQDTKPIEQRQQQLYALGKFAAVAQADIVISGQVLEYGVPLPLIDVVNKRTTQGTQTDPDGRFSIAIQQGDLLSFSHAQYESVTIAASDGMKVKMFSSNNNDLVDGFAVGIRTRTFFGRIFHKIGKIFQ